MTHGFAADLTDAGARALTRASTWRWRSPTRPTLTCPRRWSGAVSEETLDASVRRVLEAKLRMGLFDEPYVDEDHAREVLADPAHREVARIARPSGRRCCCATRVTCCRSTPAAWARSP